MLPALWNDFVGLIYPRLCLACQEPLVTGENHLCTGCRAELPYTDFHRLPPDQNPLGRRFWGKLPVRHALSYLRFVPGKQNGRAVSVSFTVPVAVK